MVRGGTVRLTACGEVLASCALEWDLGSTHMLRLDVEGDSVRGYVDDRLVADVRDTTFTCGGVALTVEEGRTATQRVRVTPITNQTGAAGQNSEERS
jgi:hypothetical protein